MSKFKIIIKGNDSYFITKQRGSLNLMLTAMSQLICEEAINNGLTKKEVVGRMKKVFESLMEDIAKGDN
jgi:hypothetical protein